MAVATTCEGTESLSWAYDGIHHSLTRADDLVGHVAPQRAPDDEPDRPQGQRVRSLLLRPVIGAPSPGELAENRDIKDSERRAN
jgi:hypothetical protein